MKPYPKYKDSGVEWIGDVPEEWEILPIKYVVKIPVTDGPHETPELLNEGIPFISAEAIKNDKIDFGKKRGFISIEEHKRFSEKYKPQKGDIYMIKSGATTGNVAVVETDDEFNIWSPLAVIRPDLKKTTTKFLFHFMKSINFFESIEIGWSFGTQQNIGMGVIENLPIVAPSIEEQISIAAYLDRKTTKIDNLISKKQRLIELLKEERAAIINQAVTKGLNPDAPMKNSGIEWLGQIPAHWKIKKIKYLLKNKKGALKTGPFGSQLKNSDLSSEGFKVYNQRSVLDKDFDSGDSLISNEKFLELRDFEIFPGDLLLTSRGTIGKCAIFPSKKIRGILHPCLIRIQFDHDLIINDYAELFIQNSCLFAESIAFNSNATTIDVIYGDTLRDVDLVFPPNIKEQNRIVMFVKKQTTKIDQITSKIEKQIDLLKEFRAALISEVITGKLDVRDGGSNG